MPEYLAAGVYIEETSFHAQSDDSFDFVSAEETTERGMRAKVDYDTPTPEATSDPEWIYVPVRRTADDEEGDIASNFRDTADGDTEATVDPYSNFSFDVDFG